MQVNAKLPSWTVNNKMDAAKLILTAGAAWATIAMGAGAADLSAGEEVFTNNCGKNTFHLFEIATCSFLRGSLHYAERSSCCRHQR
jgi:hypothetical protein